MILITYLSETGNTRRVAEAIARRLGPPCTLVPMEEADLLQQWEVIFAGFPVHRFGPSREARALLEHLPEGQPVALFVTHAMDPGSDDPGQISMLQSVLEKCKKVVRRGNLIGLIHCRGELSEATCRMLTESGLPMLAGFAAQRPETIGLPDAAALEAAAGMAEAMLISFRKTTQ